MKEKLFSIRQIINDNGDFTYAGAPAYLLKSEADIDSCGIVAN